MLMAGARIAGRTMATSTRPSQSKPVALMASAPLATASSLGDTQPVHTPMGPQRPQVPMPELIGAPFISSLNTQVAMGPVMAEASVGAAVAGCCAQMVGFAVMSFKENRWGGLVSQGLGTSMLQMPNIVRNPRVWIAPTLASAITGPIATCVFHLEMNGAPINSGMGTCGLCGLIGVWTGWVSPSEEAVAKGAAAMSPTGFDWLGLILVAIVLPAILAPLINMVCRRLGWVKDGDLKLD